MGLLGPNAAGELLKPGRVADCYLGLLLRAHDPDQAPGVLVISPAGLLHPAVPQPDGTLVYELVTGHPDRQPQQLVFLADLTVELRAWPYGTWAKLGVDPQAAASAVIGCWRHGHLTGLQYGGADRRGGPGTGAAGDDLGAGVAPRPARPPARPDVRAAAASNERTPARRRLPVTLAAGSAADSSRPDTRPRPQTAADSGRCRGVRVSAQPDTLAGRGGRRRTARPRSHRPSTYERPCAPAPARLRWSTGQAGAAGGHRR